MVDYTCGNFPEYLVNNHVGKCYAPCPFDTEASDMRTRHLLNIPFSGTLPLKTPHIGDDNKHYYMKITHSGDWGYVCTYSGCSYLLDYGIPYFCR